MEQYGFQESEAVEMMKQVFIGTSAILENDKRSLSDLIDSIATKGGITEACLNILCPEIQPVLEQTMKAGLARIQTGISIPVSSISSISSNPSPRLEA